MIDPVRLLLPGPAYLAAALCLLAAWAWIARPARIGATRKLVLSMLAAWAWILSSPGMANLLVARLEGPVRAAAPAAPDPGALVVVLASGNLRAANGDAQPRLDAPGWERLREGLRLRAQTGGTLLLTGGPPGAPRQSMAALMRAVALESGVPDSAIVLSPRSASTWEDLSQASGAIRAHSGRAWLVTSALHMPRAEAVARRLQLALTPRPCDFRQIARPTWRAWLPDDGGPALWAEALHEVVGLEYYRMRGWAA